MDSIWAKSLNWTNTGLTLPTLDQHCTKKWTKTRPKLDKPRLTLDQH